MLLTTLSGFPWASCLHHELSPSRTAPLSGLVSYLSLPGLCLSGLTLVVPQILSVHFYHCAHRPSTQNTLLVIPAPSPRYGLLPHFLEVSAQMSPPPKAFPDHPKNTAPSPQTLYPLASLGLFSQHQASPDIFCVHWSVCALPVSPH